MMSIMFKKLYNCYRYQIYVIVVFVTRIKFSLIGLLASYFIVNKLENSNKYIEIMSGKLENVEILFLCRFIQSFYI